MSVQSKNKESIVHFDFVKKSSPFLSGTWDLLYRQLPLNILYTYFSKHLYTSQSIIETKYIMSWNMSYLLPNCFEVWRVDALLGSSAFLISLSSLLWADEHLGWNRRCTAPSTVFSRTICINHDEGCWKCHEFTFLLLPHPSAFIQKLIVSNMFD